MCGDCLNGREGFWTNDFEDIISVHVIGSLRPKFILFSCFLLAADITELWSFDVGLCHIMMKRQFEVCNRLSNWYAFPLAISQVLPFFPKRQQSKPILPTHLISIYPLTFCLTPWCTSSSSSCSADRSSSSSQTNTTTLHTSTSEHRCVPIILLVLCFCKATPRIMQVGRREGQYLNISGTMKNLTCEPRI